MPGNAARTYWPPAYRKRPEGHTSPRVALALRLYATGAAKTLAQAGAIAGLGTGTLYNHRFHNRASHLSLESHIMDRITERAVDASALIRQLAVEAVETQAQIMRTGEKDADRRLAAADLLDSNPETSKTLRVAETSLQLTAEQILSLRTAMAESASLPTLPPGDSVRLPQVPQEKPSDAA